MARRSYWMGRAALLAATAAVSLVFGRAFAEDAVLLASTVPGYVPGMVVSSTDRLSVPEGASATLLFQSGEMLRLGGPFEGTLGQQQGRRAATASQCSPTCSGFTAWTRPSSAAHAPPMWRDPARPSTTSWSIRSAPAPIASSRRHRFGSPARRAIRALYAVRRKGSTRTLGWPSGAERVEWPADVPIEDGSQFEIATDGAARATVTFRSMPTSAGPGAATVATGILLGCREQFDDELRRVSRSAARPELWMTSDHGRRPTYHQGEPVALTVMADTDGYLYCVAARDDGTATPIFPAGAVDGAQVRGSVALSIPGRRQPVGLTAAPGLEQIRCWLADRDITPELPHALLGTSSGRIPDQLAGDLDGLFSRIGGTRIEADVMTVKTE